MKEVTKGNKDEDDEDDDDCDACHKNSHYHNHGGPSQPIQVIINKLATVIINGPNGTTNDLAPLRVQLRVQLSVQLRVQLLCQRRARLPAQALQRFHQHHFRQQCITIRRHHNTVSYVHL